MRYNFTGLAVYAENNEQCKKAASLFCEEIELRTGKIPDISQEAAVTPLIELKLTDENELPNKDSYKISLSGNILTISALGLRGLIFGYSYFLRKTTYENSEIILIKNISGTYIPNKSMRGHQLGYRDSSNSYDAWTTETYRRYYRDMMFFGCNQCEHIPDDTKSVVLNRHMKLSPIELFYEASEAADEFDMDVSIWYPNHDGENRQESIERRIQIFRDAKRLDYVFVPGSDPGSLPADELIERCVEFSKLLKTYKPNAEFWVSAQQPHEDPDWGTDFVNKLHEIMPDEIDGIITGPNRAFDIDDLRRKVPDKYPIRLYPDVTHNVRCEYPVHFLRNDWHHSLTSTLSRESVNPRPAEYRLINQTTKRYVIGSVSYSDGINDDVNKMIWSDMDFFPEVSLYESVSDYARVFFYGVPFEKATDAILGLEYNWMGDPVDNPNIEYTYSLFTGLLNEYPFLSENWRFMQHLFRAECDLVVKKRRRFELALVEEAKAEMKNGKLSAAREILSTAFGDDYIKLRAKLDERAALLYKLIGTQLDVANYAAKGWERGATLETIDKPITDRAWLLNRLDYADTLEASEVDGFIKRVLSRNEVADDEFYFSFAEHKMEVLGLPQEGEYYNNYQGDRPENNGSLPISMLSIYDNINLRCKLGGFAKDTDYVLKVSFIEFKAPLIQTFKLIANGHIIYEGKPVGGERDEKFDKELLGPKFESASYILPADIFENGCLELVISEPIAFVKMSEFWIKKRRD